MHESDLLAARFESHRAHLHAVAYRMLGSASEADDAVQECWLRLSRSDSESLENMRGWLTTVIGRVCLDMLRARRSRRENQIGDLLPDPIVERDPGDDPEQQALLADSVGFALLVVLDSLSPAERLAFVLHDIFAVPFTEIARVLDRSPEAARQLASRARRRVRGAAPPADADLARRREVVAAFLAASRAGDFDALLEVLDPDVVFRVETGAGRPGARRLAAGAEQVARRVVARGTPLAPLARPVLVNGSPGALVISDGRPLAVVAFAVSGGRVAEIDVLADAARLGGIDLSELGMSG